VAPDWETIETFTDPIFLQKNRQYHFRRRLEEGHRCFGYRDAGEVVCYLWLTVGKTAPAFLGADLVVPADQVYVWDCRTAESHQRRGYYSRGLRAACASPGGARRVTILTDTANVASQRAIMKSGFRPFCHFAFRRIGFLRFVAEDGGRPRLLLGPWNPPPAARTSTSGAASTG